MWSPKRLRFTFGELSTRRHSQVFLDPCTLGTGTYVPVRCNLAANHFGRAHKFLTLLVGVREKIFTRTGTRKQFFCVPPTKKKKIAYRYTKFSHTPRCHIGVHDLATQARHRPRLLSRRQRSLQTEERSYPGATDRPNYQQAWRVDIFFAYRYARSWRVETACPDHLERPGASGQLVRTRFSQGCATCRLGDSAIFWRYAKSQQKKNRVPLLFFFLRSDTRKSRNPPAAPKPIPLPEGVRETNLRVPVRLFKTFSYRYADPTGTYVPELRVDCLCSV